GNGWAAAVGGRNLKNPGRLPAALRRDDEDLDARPLDHRAAPEAVQHIRMQQDVGAVLITVDEAEAPFRIKPFDLAPDLNRIVCRNHPVTCFASPSQAEPR